MPATCRCRWHQHSKTNHLESCAGMLNDCLRPSTQSTAERLGAVQKDSVRAGLNPARAQTGPCQTHLVCHCSPTPGHGCHQLHSSNSSTCTAHERYQHTFHKPWRYRLASVRTPWQWRVTRAATVRSNLNIEQYSQECMLYLQQQPARYAQLLTVHQCECE
jgi:hypothetical protein